MVFFAKRLNAGPTAFRPTPKTLCKTCKQGTILVILKTYCAACTVEIALGIRVRPQGIDRQSKRQRIGLGKRRIVSQFKSSSYKQSVLL